MKFQVIIEFDVCYMYVKPGFHKALQQPYNTVATILEIKIRSIYNSCMLNTESIQQPQLYGNQALNVLKTHESHNDKIKKWQG